MIKECKGLGEEIMKGYAKRTIVAFSRKEILNLETFYHQR